MEIFICSIVLWALISGSTSTPVPKNPPLIGAYKINFRGDIVQVVSEQRNSKVQFPLLRPTYYSTVTYEFLCNATYPVHWKYTGFGAPNAHVITVRKDNDSFQSKVVFSFTENLQSGKYICESTQGQDNSDLTSYFNLNVGNDTSDTVEYAVNSVNQIKQQNQNDIIELTPSDPKLNLKGSSSELICCNDNNEQSNSFPKLRQQQCSSVSDCGLRIPYMENHPQPDLYLPLANYHKETIDGKSCAIFDLHENYMHDHGLVQCSIDGTIGNKYIMYSQTNDHTNMYTSFKSLPQTDTIMKIYVEPTKDQNVFISCITNGFFFSQGIKIGIQNTSSKNKIEYLNQKGKVSIQVPKSSVSGKTVYCFAPVWNSMEWKNISMTVE